jgi:hypothetical protein
MPAMKLSEYTASLRSLLKPSMSQHAASTTAHQHTPQAPAWLETLVARMNQVLLGTEAEEGQLVVETPRRRQASLQFVKRLN